MASSHRIPGALEWGLHPGFELFVTPPTDHTTGYVVMKEPGEAKPEQYAFGRKLGSGKFGTVFTLLDSNWRESEKYILKQIEFSVDRHVIGQPSEDDRNKEKNIAINEAFSLLTTEAKFNAMALGFGAAYFCSHAEYTLLKECHSRHVTIEFTFPHAFLVLNRIPGVTLAEYKVTAKTYFPFTQALLREMKRVHDLKINHADPRPENIMVLEEKGLPSVTLIDYGSGRLDGQSEEYTRGYDIDHISRYALGGIVYELPEFRDSAIGKKESEIRLAMQRNDNLNREITLDEALRRYELLSLAQVKPDNARDFFVQIECVATEHLETLAQYLEPYLIGVIQDPEFRHRTGEDARHFLVAFFNMKRNKLISESVLSDPLLHILFFCEMALFCLKENKLTGNSLWDAVVKIINKKKLDREFEELAPFKTVEEFLHFSERFSLELKKKLLMHLGQFKAHRVWSADALSMILDSFSISKDEQTVFLTMLKKDSELRDQLFLDLSKAEGPEVRKRILMQYGRGKLQEILNEKDTEAQFQKLTAEVQREFLYYLSELELERFENPDNLKYPYYDDTASWFYWKYCVRYSLFERSVESGPGEAKVERSPEEKTAAPILRVSPLDFFLKPKWIREFWLDEYERELCDNKSLSVILTGLKVAFRIKLIHILSENTHEIWDKDLNSYQSATSCFLANYFNKPGIFDEIAALLLPAHQNEFLTLCLKSKILFLNNQLRDDKSSMELQDKIFFCQAMVEQAMQSPVTRQFDDLHRAWVFGNGIRYYVGVFIGKDINRCLESLAKLDVHHKQVFLDELSPTVYQQFAKDFFQVWNHNFKAAIAYTERIVTDPLLKQKILRQFVEVYSECVPPKWCMFWSYKRDPLSTGLLVRAANTTVEMKLTAEEKIAHAKAMKDDDYRAISLALRIR